MRAVVAVVLVIVGLGGAAAGLHGQPAGWVWAAGALLGLVGHLFAGRARRPGATPRGPRLYSMVFAAVLVSIAVVFAVLAFTGGAEHRDAFTGMAILWTVLALAAVLLVVGVERRLRTPRARQSAGENPPTR